MWSNEGASLCSFTTTAALIFKSVGVLFVELPEKLAVARTSSPPAAASLSSSSAILRVTADVDPRLLLPPAVVAAGGAGAGLGPLEGVVAGACSLLPLSSPGNTLLVLGDVSWRWWSFSFSLFLPLDRGLLVANSGDSGRIAVVKGASAAGCLEDAITIISPGSISPFLAIGDNSARLSVIPIPCSCAATASAVGVALALLSAAALCLTAICAAVVISPPLTRGEVVPGREPELPANAAWLNRNASSRSAPSARLFGDSSLSFSSPVRSAAPPPNPSSLRFSFSSRYTARTTLSQIWRNCA
mmetsp:Transcript_28210/g.71606  ORF Transcript_28210/g.71606 Transcript_28210/m.71606 type:complete len:301 (-) Transcript_28210:1317-2219(-)